MSPGNIEWSKLTSQRCRWDHTGCFSSFTSSLVSPAAIGAATGVGGAAAETPINEITIDMIDNVFPRGIH